MNVRPPIRYGSVCSGIEAATAAWHPLGWEPAWFCEIDAFPCAVLAHHHPEVPNHGDFTQLLDPTHPARHGAPIDVLVGGTPCQSFSHAGGRAGLDDPRGQLMLRYLDLVGALRPRWIVWENVPGVLSSGGGRDFGSLLGGLANIGYGVAYRVLDARFFGVPQRRRRVFVVGHSGGDPERAARVLALDEGVRGHSAARGNSRKKAAASTGSGAAVGGEPFTLATRTRPAGVVLEYRQDGTADCLRAPNGGRDGIGVGAVAVTPFDTTQGGAAVGGEQVTSFTANMGGNDGGVYSDGTVATLRVEAQPAVALPGTVDPTPRPTGFISTSGKRSSPRTKDFIYVVQQDFSAPIDCGGSNPDRHQGGTIICEPAVAYGISSDALDRSGESADGSAARRSGMGIDEGLSPCLKGRANAVVIGALGCVGFQSNLGSHGGGAYEDESVTLKAAAGGRGSPAAVAFLRECGAGYFVEDSVAGTLDATSAKHTERAATVFQLPVGVDIYNHTITGDVSVTMCSKPTGGYNGSSPMALVATGDQGHDLPPPLSADADKGDQDTLVLQPVSTSVSSGRGWWSDSDVAASLRAQDSANKADTLVVGLQNLAFSGDVAPTLDTSRPSRGGGAGVMVQGCRSVVRRLTPRECERLQGFPDDWTAIPYKGKLATDGHRYKALGNSMAVPVMCWIGERIQQEDARSDQPKSSS